MLSPAVGRSLAAVAAASIVLALGALYLLTASSADSYGHDASVYLGLARSLAEGAGYEFNGRSHTQYPPGLPLFLALFVRFEAALPRVMYLVMAAWGAAAVWVTYLWLRARKERWSLLVVTLVAASPSFYALASGPVMSDGPYLALSLGLLAWSESLEGTSPARRTRPAWLALGAGLLTAALLMRAVAVALLAALLCNAVHRRLRRDAAAVPPRDAATSDWLLVLVGVSTLLAWAVWVLLHRQPAYPGDSLHSYVDQFLLLDPHRPDAGLASLGDILARLPRAAVVQGAHATELLTNLSWVKPSWFTPFVWVPLLLCLLGVYAELRRPNSLAAWYALSYGGVLLLWPFDEGRRFLLALAPLLFVFFLAGGRTLARWAATTSPRSMALLSAWTCGSFLVLGGLWSWLGPGGASRQDLAALAVWAVGLVLALGAMLRRPEITSARLAPALRALPAGWLLAYAALGGARLGPLVAENLYPLPDASRHAPVRRATEWLRVHSELDDVVMAADHAALYYWTGRPVVPLPVTGRADVLVETLRAARPRFVVIQDAPDYPYYFPVEPDRFAVMRQALPGEFALVHQYFGGSVYEWRGRGASVRAGSRRVGSQVGVARPASRRSHACRQARLPKTA